MRTIATVLWIVLCCSLANGQKEISEDRLLCGYTALDGIEKNYVIRFRRHHAFTLWDVAYRGHRSKRERGVWKLEGDILTLTESAGKTLLVLERQKGDWYLRDKNIPFITRGTFMSYRKAKALAKAGC